MYDERLPRPPSSRGLLPLTSSYFHPPSKVFDAEATQEAVYESGARDVVLGAIDGFNGTIFAYVDEERGRRDRARVDGRRMKGDKWRREEKVMTLSTLSSVRILN